MKLNFNLTMQHKNYVSMFMTHKLNSSRKFYISERCKIKCEKEDKSINAFKNAVDVVYVNYNSEASRPFLYRYSYLAIVRNKVLYCRKEIVYDTFNKECY